MHRKSETARTSRICIRNKFYRFWTCTHVLSFIRAYFSLTFKKSTQRLVQARTAHIFHISIASPSLTHMQISSINIEKKYQHNILRSNLEDSREMILFLTVGERKKFFGSILIKKNHWMNFAQKIYESVGEIFVCWISRIGRVWKRKEKYMQKRWWQIDLNSFIFKSTADRAWKSILEDQ